MSFQTLKRTVVLAGAILATQTLSAADPTARSGSRAAYNESTGTAILFGGATANDPGSARNYALDETWEWDGTRWIHRYPEHSPAGRSSHSMTYDSNRERVLLFGGTNGTEELSDTWVYEGRDWRQIDTPNAPVGRVSSALAFDPLREPAVLLHAVRAGDLPVRHVAYEGVRERELVLAFHRRAPLPAHEPLPLQRVEDDPGFPIVAPKGTHPEHLADDRSVSEQLLLRLGETVVPCCDDALERLRQR